MITARRVVLAGVIGASALVALTGCASSASYPNTKNPGPLGNDQDIFVTSVHLPDGRKVMCVEMSSSNEGGAGISCDWANAK